MNRPVTLTLTDRHNEMLITQREDTRPRSLKLECRPREHGAGESVTRFWKAGNVDDQKVPAPQGLDMSKWRGKAREEVRISLAAN